MEKTDAQKALDLELTENDAGASTIREYLKKLLKTVLVEEQCFSCKRPFGNSGWIYDLREPIEEAGLFAKTKSWDDVWDKLVTAL